MSPETALQRSSFRVPQMDCAAEETLVRARLETMPTVRRLRVDLASRHVEVVHAGGSEPISRALEGLALGSRLLASEPLDEHAAAALLVGGRPGTPGPPGARAAGSQARLLWTVLAINAGFFLGEAAAGLLARSMGLLGDSLDMLADAFVYGLALIAAGGGAALQGRVARVSGVLQLTLAVVGFAEVARRAVVGPAHPDDVTMMVVAALALIGNAVTLTLLRRARSGEAHIRASVIFTSNDVIINLGVIAAGALVALTGSGWPDLAVGTVVFAVVAWGALRILTLPR